MEFALHVTAVLLHQDEPVSVPLAELDVIHVINSEIAKTVVQDMEIIMDHAVNVIRDHIHREE